MTESAHRVTVEKLIAGGQGLARLDDGRVVFVPAVVPSEVVDIEVTQRENDFARASLVNVVTASPYRRTPPCPHVAAGCGGCDWQHIDADHQGGLKVEIVKEAFARTAKLHPDVALVPPLPVSARRTTVRMVATPAGSLAFHESQSSDIVPVDRCLVAHDLINDLLKRPLLKGEGEVTIRVGARTGDVAVECHAGELVDDLPSHVRKGKKARITEEVHGHTFQVSMPSFFQNSPEAAESIADSIAHIFDVFEVSGGVLVDAYGGVGLFAKLFADRFSEVVVVEGNATSCRDALVNLDGCAAQIFESPVEQWRATPADVVIADPSRSGLGKGGVRALAHTGASLIVLVSCDAVAAARDASLFVAQGYALHHVEVLDLFPETHHIEVVSVFTR